jgi:hypothetical protein
MSAETRQRFIEAMKRVEPELGRMGFRAGAHEEQGFATWMMYSRPGTALQFVCAPAGYQIEMFLRIGGVTYELADLMENERIAEWVSTNKLSSVQGDSLAAEAEWYAALLRIALAEL